MPDKSYVENKAECFIEDLQKLLGKYKYFMYSEDVHTPMISVDSLEDGYVTCFERITKDSIEGVI